MVFLCCVVLLFLFIFVCCFCLLFLFVVFVCYFVVVVVVVLFFWLCFYFFCSKVSIETRIINIGGLLCTNNIHRILCFCFEPAFWKSHYRTTLVPTTIRFEWI